MFESGVTLPLIRCGPPIINKVLNRIPGTTVVLWWKRFPEDPKRYDCTTSLTGIKMQIPAIQDPKDLLGTHLECRIMRTDSDCWCRVLLWLDQQEVCVASPNDIDRDIDDMSFDLQTTKRCLPAQATTTLTFHTEMNHVFLDIGSHTVPIEYVY